MHKNSSLISSVEKKDVNAAKGQIFLIACMPCAASELVENTLFCSICLFKVQAACIKTLNKSWEQVQICAFAVRGM